MTHRFRSAGVLRAAGLLPIASLVSLGLLAQPAAAADISVQVINTTRGLHFTPLLVTAHPEGTSLFTVGQPASAPLAMMAEGGEIEGLVNLLAPLNAATSANPAGGLLAPGASATASLTAGEGTANTRLSVVAMILPSNDGFVGLNAIAIPTEPGVYTFNLPVYDAGSEGNDEIAGSGAPGQPGFPVPPPLMAQTDLGGQGLSLPAEGFVHIHRGSLGDTDPVGGRTDIDSTRHRWLNPGARVVVTVQ